MSYNAFGQKVTEICSRRGMSAWGLFIELEEKLGAVGYGEDIGLKNPKHQVNRAFASGGSVALCEQCGRIISLARPQPQGRKRRRDRKFCDAACRQAHHRNKKKL